MTAKEIPLVSSSLSGSGQLLSALDKAGELADIIEDRKIAVFLDYDGTLTPIVSRPELAVLSDETRQTLEALADVCPVTILSGRDLADVKNLVNVPDLVYGGSHGFQISSPDHHHIRHEQGNEFLPVLDEAQEQLNQLLAGIDGTQVERKKYSIAVHYRRVAEAHIDAVETRVDKVLAQHEKLTKSTGKKVYELKPAIDWHKGKALLWLLEKLELDRPDVIPIYIGDDTTDEDAFKELDHIGGIGIIVREETSRSTYAQYALEDTDEVRDFLKHLIAVATDTKHNWCLTYTEYEPEEEGLREALCTLGNGYFATRGAAAESRADEVHYPGTYLAGGYNRLSTEIAGRMVENEDLVNLPNWLPVSFCLGETDQWLDLGKVDILSYRQQLDIKSGILYRHVRFKDTENRESVLVSRRLVHMENCHIAAEEISLTAKNWSGAVKFRSALDGTVINSGVARYKNLNSRHLEPVEAYAIPPDTLFLKVKTVQSDLRIAQAATTRVRKNAGAYDPAWHVTEKDGFIQQTGTASLDPGDTVILEKIVSLHTSRDHATSECGLEARHTVEHAASFHELAKCHILAWWQLWRRFALRFDYDGKRNNRNGLILHLYIFHLLQSVSLHTIDMDVGVPARGWHGEAYRGHIFWDELFIFPLLNFRIPEITRSLLMYRYRRLNAARLAAAEAGYRGAMYPWQSGSNGREETQVVHYNPKSGRWLPDNSHLQRHVNIAIAYNLWQYYQVTDDTEFLSFYGAEMLLEIARFLASLTSYNSTTGRYEIKHVMGPDEYHDAYPDSGYTGLNNNSYTNIMAVWVLNRALKMLNVLPTERRIQLFRKLDLSSYEIKNWEAICQKMTVIFHEDGVISQFEGFEDLSEFDWEGYREKYENIQRLDRILEAEGDTPNRYKLSKQADTLMLFYLLSTEELGRIFQDLGYRFEPEMIPKTISYYLKRTSHGSTLSRVVHSWVLARSVRPGSWKLFCEALKSDIEDIQGGTTREGIHLGAMAGTVDLMTRGYTGLEIRDGVLRFNPCLPQELGNFHMHLRYRSHTLEIDFCEDRLSIYIPWSDQSPIKIEVNDSMVEMGPGDSKSFSISCAIPTLSGDEMDMYAPPN